MLTREEVRGSWNDLVGAVQKKYSQVTGDDLAGLKGDVNQLVGVIQRKTGQTRDDIETFIRSAGAAGADMLGRIGETASDYASAASDRMRDGYEYVSDAAQEGYQVARNTVRKRPVESIAVAFVAGIATGMIAGMSLFGSSSSSRRYWS
ncbi:MAG: CsbD family protein [Pirellulales bacterium]